MLEEVCGSCKSSRVGGFSLRVFAGLDTLRPQLLGMVSRSSFMSPSVLVPAPPVPRDAHDTAWLLRALEAW